MTAAWLPARCLAITSPTRTVSVIQSTEVPRSRSGGQPGIDLSGLTPDQQFQAGLTCNGVKATPTSGFYFLRCRRSISSSLVSIPAPGTENDDKNPPRIAPRNLFDVSVGQDNIFHEDRYKMDLDLTAVNVTNKYALYNFLSTFSGTHYVTPRALTAKLTFNF